MERRRIPAGKYVVAVAALCAMLAACGEREHGGSAPPLNAAERVVHYYNWANYIGPDTIPAFEAAHGIKVIDDAYARDGEVAAASHAHLDSGFASMIVASM
ncbi:MAG TPA: hypothetical protein VN859_00700 [Steroidobacteraceae bacterium]|nr:hypothetical protein [Steroidobacteraceae bacterium]